MKKTIIAGLLASALCGLAQAKEIDIATAMPDEKFNQACDMQFASWNGLGKERLEVGATPTYMCALRQFAQLVGPSWKAAKPASQDAYDAWRMAYAATMKTVVEPVEQEEKRLRKSVDSKVYDTLTGAALARNLDRAGIVERRTRDANPFDFSNTTALGASPATASCTDTELDAIRGIKDPVLRQTARETYESGCGAEAKKAAAAQRAKEAAETRPGRTPTKADFEPVPEFKMVREKIFAAPRMLADRLPELAHVKLGNDDAEKKVTAVVDLAMQKSNNLLYLLLPAVKAGKLQVTMIMTGMISRKPGEELAAQILASSDPADTLTTFLRHFEGSLPGAGRLGPGLTAAERYEFDGGKPLAQGDTLLEKARKAKCYALDRATSSACVANLEPLDAGKFAGTAKATTDAVVNAGIIVAPFLIVDGKPAVSGTHAAMQKALGIELPQRYTERQLKLLRSYGLVE